MTKYDIKNYLEKIYNIKCLDVRTRICMPKTRQEPVKGYIIKDEDYKYAYVTLVSIIIYYIVTCYDSILVMVVKEIICNTLF